MRQPRRKYNVMMSEQQLDRLRAAAEDKGLTSADLFRRFLELGLFLLDAEKDAAKALIIEENGQQRRLVI